ncbi:unnamed protein product [Caenorhabditis nigoni]
MDGQTSTGIFYATVSALCLGSTYAPLKFIDRSDGLYFQWVQSTGQLLFGVIISFFLTPSPVIPIAMLNGMFYSIGNSLTVYIMDGVGVAVGYLLWNTGACVVGWAVTRYGWFYNKQQIPKYGFWNFAGVFVICIGGALLCFVDHVPLKTRPAPWTIEDGNQKKDKESVPKTKKIGCLLLTAFVGFLYGNFYSPISYIMSNDPGASQDVRSYFLSYCIGSFATSTVIFLGYCSFMKNVPRVNPELSKPSIVSGIIYGVGMISFFTACQNLDQIIAYPILSKAPGIIVSFWSILFFKDIQGARNILQMYGGILVTVVGIGIISISKTGGGILN